MKRIWFVLLALSLGLNAGLLYMVISHRHARGPRGFEWMGPPPDRPGPPEDNLGPPPAHGRPYGLAFARHRLDRMADWLNLDPAQREALRAILDETMPRILERRDAVRAARHRAAEQYLKPTVDPDSVRASVRQLNAAQASLDSLVAETMSREAKLLTPEQRSRYFTAMPWGERVGPDRDGPPPPEPRDR
jgi:Spy/CpxP family protein refolding chaperone